MARAIAIPPAENTLCASSTSGSGAAFSYTLHRCILWTPPLKTAPAPNVYSLFGPSHNSFQFSMS
ncbi:MAG: hypothetical protein ACK56F_11410, partial [bacterium]